MVFPPIIFLMYKCLLGDKSDNLEGIKGLGAKKMTKVIPEITGREIDLDYPCTLRYNPRIL